MGSSRYTRDGFFARLQMRAGFTHVFRKTELSFLTGEEQQEDSSSLTSFPLGPQLLLGTSLKRDLLIGLSYGYSYAPLVISRGSSSADLTDSTPHSPQGLHSHSLGISVLYFLAPQSPWHLGAQVAFISWSAEEGERFGQVPQGRGILGTPEVGYHFWLNPRLALGLVAQLDIGATQTGQAFHISEVLVRSSETSLLLGAQLGAVLSYY